MIDLADLRALDEGTMDVIPPGYAEAIAKITFAGPAHEKTVASENWLYAVNRSRQVLTKDEIAARNVRQIVARILGWSDFSDRNDAGELVELPFSPEKATELLLDPRFGWLFTQCLVFLNVPESFMPKRRKV